MYSQRLSMWVARWKKSSEEVARTTDLHPSLQSVAQFRYCKAATAERRTARLLVAGQAIPVGPFVSSRPKTVPPSVKLLELA